MTYVESQCCCILNPDLSEGIVFLLQQLWLIVYLDIHAPRIALYVCSYLSGNIFWSEIYLFIYSFFLEGVSSVIIFANIRGKAV